VLIHVVRILGSNLIREGGARSFVCRAREEEGTHGLLHVLDARLAAGAMDRLQ
jgi:hypothetical protein